jgi:hypothetical protein
VVFWLLQGQRDRGAEEAEGWALGAGQLGEHRDGDRGVTVASLLDADQMCIWARPGRYRQVYIVVNDEMGE